MPVHPEQGEWIAALLLHQWDTYDVELKADLLQLAERLGCNWWDVVIDCCVKRRDSRAAYETSRRPAILS